MRETFIALTALDALLLWVLIRTHGSWVLRAAAILVVLVLNLGVWQARASFDGYPTRQAVPDKAELLTCVVDEDAGSIYLWLVPEAKKTPSPFDHEAENVPRSYRLKYTRALHEMCVNAEEAMAGGAEVEVQGRSEGGSQVRLYELPPQGLPTKEGT